MIVRVTAPAAILLALGSVAMAAPAASASNPAASTPSQASAASKPAAPTMINIVAANNIVGRNLRDPSGADAGTVQSLVIDMRTGIVDFMLVGSSGSFNTGGSLVAVPWLALQPPAPGNGAITTKIGVDKMLHSPRINSALVDNLDQPGQRARIYGYYGYRYPGYYRYGYGRGYAPEAFAPGPAGYGALPGPGPRPFGTAGQAPGAAGPNHAPAANAANHPANSAPAPQPHQANAQQSNGQQAGPNGAALVVTRNTVESTLKKWQTTSANALQNATVYGRNGETLGDIDQVMIDADRGEVAFVLLSRGGFLGLNQRWYVLPVEALVPAPYQNGYRLTANAETLLHEPHINVDRQNLPAQVNAKQLASLYRRFGMQPYWQQTKQQRIHNAATRERQHSSSGNQALGRPASQ